MLTLEPGLRHGAVVAPPSKSHAHRLLIANFLAGDRACLADAPGDAADIAATKRCLRALSEPTSTPVLDCGESGSTLRFLAPVAAALGKRPTYRKTGRLAMRPMREYDTLTPGLHELPGDVSSQFVTGLLFALPLLAGDSEIRFTSPLESRGYVDMTLRVLAEAGLVVHETDAGFAVPGGQVFRAQPMAVEGDWSGAAFWLAMQALGSSIAVSGLDPYSAQPDRAVASVLKRLVTKGHMEIDVAQFPDSFPVLTIVAAARGDETVFTGIRRLRLKECDRVAAMAETLTGLGARVVTEDARFSVKGRAELFRGGAFRTFGDHRVAMSLAVAVTHAREPIALDDAACAAKSYPSFFDLFAGLSR